MRVIWAPWRIKYINESKKKKECFICQIIKDEKDEENLVVYRGKNTIIIMNKFPYNSSHIMISPIRHIENFYELTDEEVQEIFKLISKSQKIIKDLYNPDGFNFGVNIGKAAGAGEDHLHFHLVPRWFGDTNFMTVISETRVMPESIVEVHKKLKEAFIESNK
ncbi:MAG TPA: HIT domain-containing protein [Caldisericia bacterium]|nr:HIT domain-containing protein [Caldisericia bacterium]